jgi:hypothetical protein
MFIRTKNFLPESTAYPAGLQTAGELSAGQGTDLQGAKKKRAKLVLFSAFGKGVTYCP